MSWKNLKKSKGFTLIELMIVVAIIGILAAVAIPKFADLVTRSKEASIKGSLGAVRSAVSIYYSDTEGDFPTNLLTGLTLGARYLPNKGDPNVGTYDILKNNMGNVGHDHGVTSADGVLQNTGNVAVTDVTALAYSTDGGDIYVNCSHNDTRTNKWSSF